MYTKVFFEISGTCNARCPRCPTGKNPSQRGGFVALDRFQRAIRYLLEEGIITPEVPVYLYNFGEPLLHPQLREIVALLSRSGMRFGISTNAGVTVPFDGPDSLKGLEFLAFSMPGFSQASYDRIHQLDFRRVTENITKTLENYRRCGFTGQAQIFFHVYQFNLDEIDRAGEFAASLGISFHPYLAYFNGYLMNRSYLLSELPYADLKRASEELFLFHIEKRRKEVPAGYRCPQFDQLTLDEECNVVTCCVLDKNAPDHLIGNLFDLSRDQIAKLKESRPVCRECNDLGIGYCMHNTFFYDQTRDAGGILWERDRLRDENRRLDLEVQRVVHSRSWRITAPLRGAAELCRGLFRRAKP